MIEDKTRIKRISIPFEEAVFDIQEHMASLGIRVNGRTPSFVQTTQFLADLIKEDEERMKRHIRAIAERYG